MLSQQVEAYLRLRQEAGFELKQDSSLLRDFATFAGRHGESRVCASTAITWAAKAASAAQRGRRLRALIRFVHFVRVEDPSHELPPSGLFGGARNRPIPYVFTELEVQALIGEANRISNRDPSRARTSAVLFGLLAVTGLRISEALSLRFDDLTAEGLLIRRTKFHKSRLLPLHPSTSESLGQYWRLERPWATEDYWFVTSQGKRLTYRMARRTLRQVTQQLGLPAAAARLHNFRHSFAVRALESCPKARDRIAQHMLAVSTYLGHARICDTFWYLHRTPVLLADIADATETFWKGKQE